MSLLLQLVKKGALTKPKAVALEYEIKSSGKREEEVILENKIAEFPVFSLWLALDNTF